MRLLGDSVVVRRRGPFIVALVAAWMAATAPAIAKEPPTTAPSAPFASPRDDLPGLKNFEQVSDALCRGAQPAKDGFRTLKDRGVKTIVDLRTEHSDRELLAGMGFQYVEIRCNPFDMKEAEVVEFLKVVNDPKNQPVFVHCACGCDRTGMMVGAYRLLEQNRTTDDVLKELHDYGFHSIYKEIPKYLKDFDSAKVRKELDAARSPKVESIQ